MQAGDAAADRGLAAARTRRRARRTCPPRSRTRRRARRGRAAAAAVARPRGRTPRAAARRRRRARARGGLRRAARRARARPSGSSGRRAGRGLDERRHGRVAALLRRTRTAARTSTRPATRRRRPRRPGCPASARGRRTSGIASTSARVYGCRGRSMTSSAGAVLDHPAGVHDHDPIGHPRDDGEVVRDVDHRHALLVAQPRELGEDPILGQHVEAGGRLVEHRDRRLADARHRDRDTLLLAARELVRVAAAEAAGRCPARRARGPRAPSRRTPPPSGARAARP